jgi:hypothetical protein
MTKLRVFPQPVKPVPRSPGRFGNRFGTVGEELNAKIKTRLNNG